MKRVTQGGDINFNVTDVRGLGDNYAFRFYTTDSCRYIVKVDGDAVDDIIRLEWDELKTLGDGVLNYCGENLEPDEEYSDATFNRTFGGTTQWYIVTSCSGGGGGSSEEISELSDRLDAEIDRSTTVDNQLRDLISENTVEIHNLGDRLYSDTYTKAEVDQKIAEAEMGGELPESIVIDANYVHTDNNFTTNYKDKLDGIAAGAEVNVQADWNVTDTSSDAYIQHKPTIPSKTSDLTNNSGFLDANDFKTINNQSIVGSGNIDIQGGADMTDYYDKDETDAAISNAINQAVIETIVGNGDFAMTYDQVTDTYYIVRLVPTITVSDETLSFDSMSIGKVRAITVSGHNLKADIAITVPVGSDWTVSPNLLQQVNGAVANTEVTITYEGEDDSTANGDLTLTSDNLSKIVPMSYTQFGLPTITVDPATLSFEAIGNQSQTKTATVGKFNITGDVSVAVSGGDGKFSASLNGSTLSVTYTPGNINSGTHSATITLSASGATPKTVAIEGSVLPQTLTITPTSLTLESDNGVDDTDTINVKGQNIIGNVDVTVSGSGFTLSENSLAAADVNSANGVDVDVTANIASGSTANATISASSGLANASINVMWNKTEANPSVDDIIYKNYGYSSADGQTCDLPITFKVTSVATENSDGTVRIVKENGTEGYHSSGSNYANLKKVDIPSSITIARKTYKVTELGSGTFQGAGLVYATFETPSNVENFKHDVTNMQPFRGAASFRGTGVVDGINTFEYPSSITSTNKISEDVAGTSVKRVIVPNSVVGQLSPVGTGITHIDLGTGITGFYGNAWYNYAALTDIIIRNPNTVVGIYDYVAGQWSAETAPQRTIHVPSGMISGYENNTNWKTVKDAGKAEFVAITE